MKTNSKRAYHATKLKESSNLTNINLLPGMLTISAAARALSVSEWTIRRWKDNGVITHKKVHGRIWIPLADLEAIAGGEFVRGKQAEFARA